MDNVSVLSLGRWKAPMIIELYRWLYAFGCTVGIMWKSALFAESGLFCGEMFA